MGNKISDLLIKRLDASYVKMLRLLSIETFSDTYAQYNTEEDMHLYILEHFSEEQLEEELKDDSNYFFGSFDNSILAGYTKLRTTENPEELSGKKHIELERIYAARNYLGKCFS